MYSLLNVAFGSTCIADFDIGSSFDNMHACVRSSIVHLRVIIDAMIKIGHDVHVTVSDSNQKSDSVM